MTKRSISIILAAPLLATSCFRGGEAPKPSGMERFQSGMTVSSPPDRSGLVIPPGDPAEF